MAVNHLMSLSDDGQILDISVAIPTLFRERVLLATIHCILDLRPAPAEILVVDQTPRHNEETARGLGALHSASKIRWLRLPKPSITRAMNTALVESRGEVVVFVDDDIIPHPKLIAAHAAAQARPGCNIVAGQVLQPYERPLATPDQNGAFQFCSSESRTITELMGGNFSVKRDLAIRLGGFDENFVRVAYRFEKEFAERAIAAGEAIYFEPAASIRHLKAQEGGIRSFGHHLTTFKPSHSVGEYYYLLRSKDTSRRFLKMLKRPFNAVATRHHLSHPWWIPASLTAEALGLGWALMLSLQGPRLIQRRNE
jgi:glycosyltransferase involved in cell wall biosynthesis